MLDISKFELEQAVFEVRYAPAFLHFDRAGTVWNAVRAEWPSLRVSQAVPSQTSCETDTYQFDASLELARIIAFNPERNFQVFADSAKTFTRIIADVMEVEQFTRVGLRLIYVLATKTAAEAVEGVQRLRILTVPEQQVFGVTREVTNISYSVRLGDRTKGATINIKNDTRNLTFNPQISVRKHFHSSNEQIHGIFYDVDYYAQGMIKRGTLDVQEWVERAAQVVRRDSVQFFLER